VAEQYVSGGGQQLVICGPDTQVGAVPIQLEHEVIERGEKRLETGFTLAQRFESQPGLADFDESRLSVAANAAIGQ
jgi:hypothetical protein